MRKLLLNLFVIFAMTCNFVLGQSVGEKHNSLILEYLAQDPEITNINKYDIGNSFYQIYRNLYEDDSDPATAEKLNEILDVVFINENISSFSNTDFYRMIDYSEGQGYITPRLAVFAKDLVNNEFHSYTEMTQFIDNFKNSTENLTVDEIRSLDTARDIVLNSHSLWASVYRTKDPTAAVIVADLVGGFVFSPLTVLAPIASGMISLAVHACTKKKSC